MKFNRYEILTTHYTNEIRLWNWIGLVQRFQEYTPEGYDPQSDEPLEGAWIGTVFGLFPSGKVYAPWTTNQTRSDVVRDECFSDALEAVAGRYGLVVDYSGEDVFLIRPKGTA
jgi:hypothetical protein